MYTAVNVTPMPMEVPISRQGSKYLLKDSLIPQMVADDRTVVVHFMPTVPVDRSRLESKVVVRVRPGGFLVRDPMESIELGTYVVYRKCLCCRI